MAGFEFDRLRRTPDIEAQNLYAYDAADRLLLDLAADFVGGAAGGAASAVELAAGKLVVVDDSYGALTLGAAALFGARGIRVHQDSIVAERALAGNAARLGFDEDVVATAPAPASVPAGAGVAGPLPAGLFRDARLVLLRLPRSLDALDELAEAIAAQAPPGVTVLAGGMVKHMTLAMNEVLGRRFGEVTASRARSKARVLTASRPTRGQAGAAWPRRTFHEDLGLWVVAHGGTFAGDRVDIGTRAMLAVFDALPADAQNVVDLGCGTGLLAAAAGLRLAGRHVVATDQSAAAVASARATADANGVGERVTVVRDDAGSGLPAGEADLVLLNPPFHVGSTVHAGIGRKLIAAAGRLVRPGGQVWTVFNSHLAYQPTLRREIGPTRQLARTPKFTVTASTRRA